MSNSSDLKGQSVLVTGAAGCIGAWTVKILRELGATPVVYDLGGDRHRHDLIMDDAAAIQWVVGDITDKDQLVRAVDQHGISAIIHLAALQVPFCKADPVGSARVNVVGTANILEVARQAGIGRLSYASSIAAPAMGDNEWLATLYGAHKVCGEQMAAVYWQDWGVASVGIRPAIVYGPARDQGMSAAPTIAMLAAVAGEAYKIPFSGSVSFIHAEDVALRFVAAVGKKIDGAHVFDANGTRATIADVLGLIRSALPQAALSYDGAPLPFPASDDDGSLDAFLDIHQYRTMEQGVASTLALFEQARTRLDIVTIARDIIRKNP